MAKKLGLNAKVWVKAGETDVTASLAGAAPTGATEWLDVTDITFSDSYTEAETTTRRMSGVKTYYPALRDISLSVPVKKDDDDAAYTIVKAGAVGRSVVAVWILDGPVTSAASEGVAFNAYVFGGDEDQPLDDVIGKTLVLKPCDSQYAVTAIAGSAS